MKLHLLLLLLVIKASAQPVVMPKIEFSPKTYVCYKTDKPISVDGLLEEDVWQKTDWTDDFVDIEGTIRPSPRFKTRAKMLWDEKYFYVAAELEEPDIWGTLTDRDAVIFYDNDFEVFIDPDGDTHQYYEYEMNALNTVWDLLLVKPYRDGGPAVNGWDIKGLRSGVKINGTVNEPGDTDRSWTLEIAFPWDALKECANKKAPPGPGDQWRVNFSRVEWKVEKSSGKYLKTLNPETNKPYPEDNWVWSPQGLINMHYPEMWGFVQFSDKTAEEKSDRFNINPDEGVKWDLRRIYYKEKEFFEVNNKYSDDLNELRLQKVRVEGYSVPVIHASPAMFDAMMISSDGKTEWHISQDGLTWKNQNR